MQSLCILFAFITSESFATNEMTGRLMELRKYTTTDVHVYTRICVYTQVCTCMNLVYIIYAYTHAHTYTHIRTYACEHICIYKSYMYTYISIHVLTHIPLYTPPGAESFARQDFDRAIRGRNTNSPNTINYLPRRTSSPSALLPDSVVVYPAPPVPISISFPISISSTATPPELRFCPRV